MFSPDVKYVAAVSEDGCLRVIDAMSEQSVYFPSEGVNVSDFVPLQTG